MFKQLNLKIIGGIAFIAILLLSGVYLYSQWSYKRFASELDVPPQSSTLPETVSESNTIKPSEQSKPTLSTESVNENLKDELEPIAETDVKEVSEFDASSLLSTFGMPEEVTSLLDEDVREEDFEKAQEHLTETYGKSPETLAVIDKLKQLSNTTLRLDDLTELLETWIDVLPEEQHEIRQRLMKSLAQLQQVKGLSGNTLVRLMAAPELNPTQSGGPGRVTIQGGNARVIQGDKSRVIIKDAETETK